MDWVKLAVRFYADPKIAALPDEASELMYIRGLARAGEEQAGGFIPESALPELARRRRYAACVDALVAAGLWSRVDGGYRITRWADWQDGLDALARRRAADRERQRRRRAAVDPTKVTSRDRQGSSRDTRLTSRDASRDVTGLEEDRDLEPVGSLTRDDVEVVSLPREPRELAPDSNPQVVDFASHPLAQKANRIAGGTNS